jgi:hypothetical protein
MLMLLDVWFLVYGAHPRIPQMDATKVEKFS